MLPFLLRRTMGLSLFAATPPNVLELSRSAATRTFITTARLLEGTKERKPKKTTKESNKAKDEPQYEKKDLRPPFKKPLGYYFKFAKELRASPETAKLDYAEIAQRWAALTPPEKQVYDPDPAEMSEYRTRYNKWKTSLSPQLRKAIKESRKRTTIGTFSGYNLCVQEMYNDPSFEGLDAKVRFAKISATWAAFTLGEKEQYNQRASVIFEERKARHQAQSSD